MKEVESDIKITSVMISKKQLFAQCQKKNRKDVMEQKADLAVQRIQN